MCIMNYQSPIAPYGLFKSSNHFLNNLGPNLHILKKMSCTIQKVILHLSSLVYRKHKTKFKMESNLAQVTNTSHRRALTKLRLSDHKLEIEGGRHIRPKINKNNYFDSLSHCVSFIITNKKLAMTTAKTVWNVNAFPRRRSTIYLFCTFVQYHVSAQYLPFNL